MKVILPILPKIGCHGNVPWGIRNIGPDYIGEKIVKIGPVDPELVLLN